MSNQMSYEIEMIESQINNVVINYNNKVIEYEYNLKMLGECNNNYTCYYNKYYECLENINSIKYSIDYNIHDKFDNMMLNSLLKEYNAELNKLENIKNKLYSDVNYYEYNVNKLNLELNTLSGFKEELKKRINRIKRWDVNLSTPFDVCKECVKNEFLFNMQLDAIVN